MEKRKKIGFVHPGAMGISLAVSAQATNHLAYWVPCGRSKETRERAERYDLLPTEDFAELSETCSIIISVCPPHAAVDVAEKFISCPYDGIYADVNAISPEKSKLIAAKMTKAGIDYVDGGIIGGPAWEAESTWLYLSGKSAEEVADCFTGGLLNTHVIDEEIGKASALKMSFAAYTKGTTALLCAIMATADDLGVRDLLEQQWSHQGSDFAEKTRNRVRGVTAKAWRFSGEMEEIASTFKSSGLPPGFHLAASDVYERLAKFKGVDPKPSLEEVLAALKETS